MFDRANGCGIGNLVVQDDLRLLFGALRLRELLEGSQWAIRGRLLIKQNGLRTRVWLQTQAGVQVLEIVTRTQCSAIKLLHIVFTRPEIVRDGALKRTRRFADDAFGVIDHTCNLVGSQFLKQYPCPLTNSRRTTCTKGLHEQRFVIAYLALFKLPAAKM